MDKPPVTQPVAGAALERVAVLPPAVRWQMQPVLAVPVLPAAPLLMGALVPAMPQVRWLMVPPVRPLSPAPAATAAGALPPPPIHRAPWQQRPAVQARAVPSHMVLLALPMPQAV